MSLIGWWPLNGDTKDYSGNNNHGEIVGNVVQDNNGKIGKSYCWNGDDENKHYIQIKNFLPEKMNEYTFAFWINSMNISKKQTILTSRDYNRGIQISLERYVAIYFDNENGSNMFSDFNDLESNQWYHIAISFNSEHNNIKTYVNGKFTSEDNMDCSLIKSLNSIRLGQRYYKDDYFYRPDTFNGNINDVRIYNHELSAGEIKELAKAKVLHYKFNNEYEEPTKNMKLNTVFSTSKYGQDYFIKNKAEDWFRGLIMKNVMVHPSKTYTFSLEVMSHQKFRHAFDPNASSSNPAHNTNDNAMSFHKIRYPNGNTIYDTPGKWVRVSLTSTMKDNAVNPTMYHSYCPYLMEEDEELKVYVRNVQFEEKDHATAYRNNSSTVIPIGDCSGYNNHGLSDENNQPSFNYDQITYPKTRPIFNKSSLQIIKPKEIFKVKTVYSIEPTNDVYKFNNVSEEAFDFSKGFIRANKKYKLNKDTFTVSFWAKEYSYQDVKQGYVLWKNPGLVVHLNSSNKKQLRMRVCGDKDWATNLVVDAHRNDNTWNHFSFSFNNGIQKIYMNGKLLGSNNADITTVRDDEVPMLIGNRDDGEGTYFNGCLSDLKIYHTALSDEDILNDYQVKAKVRKTGAFETKQIIEKKNLLDEKIILERRFIRKDPAWKDHTKLLIKDNRNCLQINPVTFHIDESSINDKIHNSIFPKNYFKPNTSYTFNLTVNSHVIHQGIEKNSGFIIRYTDKTLDSFTFSTTGSWEKKCLRTKDNKTIDGITVFYFTGVSWFIDLDRSYIVENTPANINKKGMLIASEINEVDTLNFETKTEHGADWVRIFYHDCRSGAELFSNDFNEFLKCNTEYKKSDMWALEQFRGQDEKFEFLLEYQSLPGEYNRWKQSSNPAYELANGYEPIKISWSLNLWGGLEASRLSDSTSIETWIDGSINHTNWFYSIGTRRIYQGGSPGPNNTEKGWVKLWVRCDNPEAFKIYKNGEIRATEFIEN